MYGFSRLSLILIEVLFLSWTIVTFARSAVSINTRRLFGSLVFMSTLF